MTEAALALFLGGIIPLLGTKVIATESDFKTL
jgi:hypothetical protein